MGGNIFPECQRVNRETYDQLRLVIEERFNEKFGYGNIYFPKTYGNKESFGDVDVLVEGLLNTDIKSLPALLTGTSFYNENESNDSRNLVVSGVINTKGGIPVQVDFIKVGSLTRDFSYRYFSFNDLGNLIGVLAKQLGFRFGHDGLWFPLLDQNGHVYEKVLVTNRFHEAMDILGYDYPEDLEFQDLESIFSFVSSNSLFDPNWYKLENHNSKNRVRDRKRFTYIEFLAWLDVKGEEYFNPESFDKDAILYKTIATYPLFEERYFEIKGRMDQERLYRSAWNGEIVANITGLPSGLGLGLFMDYCKKSQEDFTLFIMQKNKTQIETFIKECHDRVKLMSGN